MEGKRSLDDALRFFLFPFPSWSHHSKWALVSRSSNDYQEEQLGPVINDHDRFYSVVRERGVIHSLCIATRDYVEWREGRDKRGKRSTVVIHHFHCCKRTHYRCGVFLWSLRLAVLGGFQRLMQKTVWNHGLSESFSTCIREYQSRNEVKSAS